MKNILDNIRNYLNDDENPNKKPILFFGFYLIFFAVLFGIIIFGGDKNYLHQEYEKGNSSINKGILNKNFVYDYKVTVDGTLYDYYGKRYGDTELFKYNNVDYYHDKDEFFSNQGTWAKSENPYHFYEFIDFDNVSLIIGKATFMAKTEYENGKIAYHYLISNNTLNQILYSEDTDYDDEPDSIDVMTDSSNNVEQIVYTLNYFCLRRDNCNQNLKIEMNFEMFGNVEKIDNPME